MTTNFDSCLIVIKTIKGRAIAQVGEPTLRKVMPMHEAKRQDYLRWAADSFRLDTEGENRNPGAFPHVLF